MTNTKTPKARTIEQLVSDFRRERPNEPESLYALVRKYIIDARTEVTLQKAHATLNKNIADFSSYPEHEDPQHDPVR